MATSKTSKASKTVEKKSGRKTAENSPQTGEERFIATGKSVTLLKPAKGARGVERHTAADRCNTGGSCEYERPRASRFSD